MKIYKSKIKSLMVLIVLFALTCIICKNTEVKAATTSVDIYLFKGSSYTYPKTLSTTKDHILATTNGNSPEVKKEVLDVSTSKKIADASLSGLNHSTVKIKATNNIGKKHVYVWKYDGKKPVDVVLDINVHVIDYPTLSLDKTSVALWVGDTTNIKATGSNKDITYAYSWSSGSSTLMSVTNNTSQSCSIKALSIPTTANVLLNSKVTAIDSCGTKKELTKSVNVNIFAKTVINSLSKTNINMWIGEKVNVSMNTSGNISSRTWGVKSGKLADGAITNTTSDTVTINGAAFTNETAFVLTAMAKYSCAAGTMAPMKECNVHVYKKPQITGITNSNMGKGEKTSENIYMYVGQSVKADMNVTGTVNGYSWTANDTGLSITDNTKQSCLIKADKEGTYTIKCVASANNIADGLSNTSVTREIAVFVYRLPKLQLYEGDKQVTSLEMIKGDTKELTCNFDNKYNTDYLINISVTSADNDRASASVVAGKVIINAKNNTYNSKVNVTVTGVLRSDVYVYSGSSNSTFSLVIPVAVKDEVNDEINVQSVDFLNHDNVYINKGNKHIITANVLPADASNKVIRYSSSDETVAKINEKGEIRAVGYGWTTIMAQSTDGTNCQDSITVYVNLSTPKNIVITKGTDNNPVISWSGVKEAYGYRIWRKTNGS
ncbi:MAG: Ig-like domain-containing protein, partial [Lachnospiraceae bacterium]|nr:Ig-like domain-containing protein [Lachnospiraceae bacterium]